jgi:hypothetical protein
MHYIWCFFHAFAHITIQDRTCSAVFGPIIPGNPGGKGMTRSRRMLRRARYRGRSYKDMEQQGGREDMAEYLGVLVTTNIIERDGQEVTFDLS